MNMKILTRDEHFLKLRIEDEPYTMYNLLRHIIAQRDDVKMVGFAKTETFKDVIVFQLETNEDATMSPMEILKEAAGAIMKMSDDFLEAMNNVLS